MTNLLLAGDVGGTKTVLAALRPGAGGALAGVAEATFENRRYDGVETIVAEFLARFALRVQRASLSVAGPVADGRTVLSNLGWELDRERLRAAFGLASVELLNDLQATAFAVPRLPAEQLATLQRGRPAATGLRAVIAPGTGLGEAFLLWDGARLEAWPSEGGNADFAPADELQGELLRWMRGRQGYVSVEHVCSGLGIPNVYAFLRDTGVEAEPAWLAERLAAAVDPTPTIVEGALGATSAPVPICVRTMQLFVDILGAEAGSMALRLLPTGGVYVGGGIPPRILPLLQDGRFVRAFRRKGRFAELMAAFPVHVILEPRAPLIGAAHYAVARSQPPTTPPSVAHV